MQFVITNLGIQAAANAQAGGPKITITQFKVGSAYGYTPSVADTALHGTVLHTSSSIDYEVQSDNVIVYTLSMNTTVGTFDFGEVGLYLDTGELFALAVNPIPITKSAGATGNVINIDAAISLNNIVPYINFNYAYYPTARVAETSYVKSLINPVAAASNTYITNDTDESGNYILAIAKTISPNNAIWTFPTHPALTVSGVVDSATTTSITSTSISTNIPSGFIVGEYIVEFTSGILQGQCRLLNNSSTNVVTWVDAVTSTPATGTSFKIYASVFHITNNRVIRSGDTMTGILNLFNGSTAPTQTAGDSSTKIASTAFVQTAVAMPSGTKLLFPQSAAPTGWTQITTDTANNRMLRVVNTSGGGIGGTHSPILNNVVPEHTHTITINTGGDHSHTISDPGHSHTLYKFGASFPDGGGYVYYTAETYGSTYNDIASATGITVNAGGAHSHTASSDTGSSKTNWQPRYLDLILCSKN